MTTEEKTYFIYVRSTGEKVPPHNRGLSPFVIDFLSNFQSRTLRTLRTIAADLPNDWIALVSIHKGNMASGKRLDIRVHWFVVFQIYSHQFLLYRKYM